MGENNDINSEDKKEDSIDSTLSVEKSLKKLEGYVEILEKGDTDLDKSFKVFEAAVKVSKKLKKKLDSYERKIEIINGSQ